MEKKFAEFLNKINPDSRVEEYRFYYKEKELDLRIKFAEEKDICQNTEKKITIAAVRKLRIKCPKCLYNECILDLKDHHSYCAMYHDY